MKPEQRNILDKLEQQRRNLFTEDIELAYEEALVYLVSKVHGNSNLAERLLRAIPGHDPGNGEGWIWRRRCLDDAVERWESIYYREKEVER